MLAPAFLVQYAVLSLYFSKTAIQNSPEKPHSGLPSQKKVEKSLFHKTSSQNPQVGCCRRMLEKSLNPRTVCCRLHSRQYGWRGGFTLIVGEFVVVNIYRLSLFDSEELFMLSRHHRKQQGNVDNGTIISRHDIPPPPHPPSKSNLVNM